MSQGNEDPFKRVAAFLVRIGKLKEKEALIYELGLRRIVITTKDVIKELKDLNLRQSTAGDILRRLAEEGYFKGPPNNKSKHSLKKFRAEPPSITLKDVLSEFSEVKDLTGPIEEHFEQNALNSTKDDDIWLCQSEDQAIDEGASIMLGAKKNIKICSNDCSWLDEPAIEGAFKKLLRNNISIHVTGNPTPKKREELGKRGVKITLAEKVGIPFCIVDDSILLLVSQTGSMRKRYNIITTTQPYMVSKQIELFDNLSNKLMGGKIV